MSARTSLTVHPMSADDDKKRGEHAYDASASVIRVPCPGCAHRRSHDELCLVCDEETDGTISVVITELERAALDRAAHGLPVDIRLSPRLEKLGLLHEAAGCTLPTESGYALLGDPRVRAS